MNIKIVYNKCRLSYVKTEHKTTKKKQQQNILPNIQQEKRNKCGRKTRVHADDLYHIIIVVNMMKYFRMHFG